MQHVAHEFDHLVEKSGFKGLEDPRFAALLDEKDPLASFRDAFHIPPAASPTGGKEGDAVASIYLCGNSLGLQPKRTKTLLEEELDVWRLRGVEGHFDHEKGRPWVTVDEHCVGPMAQIVGASSKEVAIMDTLTANLHLMMVAFYRPSAGRFKILMEAKSFPSDAYAIQSQVKFHGYDPKEAIVLLSPRENEETFQTQDILKLIQEEGDSIALILLGGVNYYTGQVLPMKDIVEAGHAKGCTVGFDLAHAAGNVELKLHDWNVDFACWCTYKYLNSGPGGIAGLFIHERHDKDTTGPRFSGWWGHDKSSRFNMDHGAQGYQLSNPCVLAMTALLGSLQIFEKTSMADLTKKSRKLSGYLRLLIERGLFDHVEIITPSDFSSSAAQLSLKLKHVHVNDVFKQLIDQGIICDKREPDVIRIAPAPLYNSFSDCNAFYRILSGIVRK